MAEYEWPDDPEFRRVAARIADAVTVAINSGVRIGTRRGCRCPLGCFTRVTQPDLFKFSRDRNAKKLGWSGNHVSAFYIGFEGWKPLGVRRIDRAYFRLGRAYRERFVR